MSYKDKRSYDDMGQAGTKRRPQRERMDRKSLRIIVTVVIVGVLLCASVVVLWIFIVSPGETVPQTQSSEYVIVEPLTTAEVAKTPPEPLLEEVAIVTPPPVRSAPPSTARTSWYQEYVVQEGETLDSLVETFGISRETILSVNAIKNLSAIKAGLSLRIPHRNGQLYTVQEGDNLSIITNRFNATLGWKTLQEINGLQSEVIFPGQKLFIPSAQADDDGSLASYDRFVRPAEGKIAGLYGQPVVYGNSEAIVVLQGIWIEGSPGSDVKASGTGVVVDTGNIPDGKGRFVVLSHENGYKTTYAHLEQVLVKVSDQVKQGETLGTMGKTGNIGRTALYFQIEQEGTALNPANFF
ncbi:MAG: M23 family metallopeptidase [Sphaerochaetaceae bacterium]|jgi:murein DD-endopeptidase MepM/ murein hydrolase activator NlpD|nr:M23 family metallopeptidase [Sphaerochaetaceae bacterium]MDY0370962.1 M23 family metallopeptidase [Sphaerochaetaceae bacterium]